MTRLALLLDEDVRVLLAGALRDRGYDAVHVLEADRGGRSDPEQLAYAVAQGRAILTHNIRDFMVLDREYRATGKEHCGIIVSDQIPLRELLRRILRCVSQCTADEACNRLIWLHNFRS